MGIDSDGQACDSSTSSAGCLEPLQLRGGWAQACDATEVLQLAHALAAPLDGDARDGGAGLLRLRLRCDEGPPAHALPRGVLSPYANAVCMVAQALRLGGGRPAPGAPPLHALDVAMPDWAQPWECATVAVAFAWSLSEPGPLRTLALHLPPPRGLALLEPQHAAALREVRPDAAAPALPLPRAAARAAAGFPCQAGPHPRAAPPPAAAQALRMRQANERLALLMGTHKRLGANSLIKVRRSAPCGALLLAATSLQRRLGARPAPPARASAPQPAPRGSWGAAAAAARAWRARAAPHGAALEKVAHFFGSAWARR